MPSSKPSVSELVALEFNLGSAQDQIEFDIEFFGHVLRRNSDNVDVLRCQVELLARVGRHDEALSFDYRLVHLRPEDFIARYNLACTLSVLGEVNEALLALDQALELGYRDLAHLESDADLETVRNHPSYREILRKHGYAVGS